MPMLVIIDGMTFHALGRPGVNRLIQPTACDAANRPIRFDGQDQGLARTLDIAFGGVDVFGHADSPSHRKNPAVLASRG